MRRVLLVLLAGIAACDEADAPSPGRGVPSQSAPQAAVTDPSDPPASGPRAGSTPLRGRTRSVRPAQPFVGDDDRGTPGDPGPGADPAAGPSGEEPERDLGAELHRALGDPTGCLSPVVASELPDRLSIDLDVHISLTGVVTRAEARSSHLPDPVTRCIEERAERIRLEGPIEGAPRAASTTLTLERQKSD